MDRNVTTEKYLDLYYKILRIRMVEEEIAVRYPQGKMRCPTHLSIGQEAVSVMVCENLHVNDLAVSTHRAHAHYLAKGGSLRNLIAELYGKAAGSTHGRGGSMNLSDLAAGFVVSTAIVGNTIPIGVGLSFAQKLNQENAVTCVFLGDAAVEEGVFYESMNFAVLKKLPVLFVCENNFYSVNTPLELRQPKDRKISNMVEAMGAKVRRLDGNAVTESYAKVCDAIADLRSNGGVWFLELETYRYKVHCGPEDDHHSGRPRDEFNYWFSKDPINTLKNYLLDLNLVDEKKIEDWRRDIQKEINDAFAFAENAPFPSAEESFRYRYANTQADWLQSMLTKKPEGVLA